MEIPDAPHFQTRPPHFPREGDPTETLDASRGSSRHRGTVVWIGPVDLPESADAYRYCADHAPQIAPRRSIEHLLERPADGVGMIIHVRNDRAPAPMALDAMLQRFPGARRAALLGSGCEGEARTGNPWPGFESFYWHQWNQVLPNWICPPGEAVLARPRRRAVGLVAAYRPSVDAIAESIAAWGHIVFWMPAPTATTARNLDVCVWDDSAAPPTSTSGWRDRLAEASRHSGHPDRMRHIWLANFPRPDDWVAARRAGVEAMFSKPFASAALASRLGVDAREKTTRRVVPLSP